VVTINSLVPNHSRKAGSFLIFQEISRIYGTRTFLTAFITAHHLFMSWNISVYSTPAKPI